MKNRIREIRTERQWSQSELAGKLGVSRQTIHSIETGKYDPSLPLAFKISFLLNQPLERIFIFESEDSDQP
jgi:putative transcriptional regulator